MQRWSKTTMEAHGKKRFHKLCRQKRHAHHNHDIHFLAREQDSWLPSAVQTLIDGSYDPLPLKRLVFPDNVVDQLAIPDTVLQNVLLYQLKPTFKHVINSRCYHMQGPSGVKVATEKIREALLTNDYHYFIRMDIQSFYASIPKYKLISDINALYSDVRVQNILKRIIYNPIELPNGISNPDHGIALRGPLSQFFSAIYLKPLDDALSTLDVLYVRYNDDFLLLCRTKRQLTRAKRIISQILHERRLKLSRKKTRIGNIETGFHFLGIDYLGTQLQDNTAANRSDYKNTLDDNLTGGG